MMMNNFKLRTLLAAPMFVAPIFIALLLEGSSLAMAKESFFSLKANGLNGKEVDFKQYSGKVVLIVNTASKCGYTPQFGSMQTIHKKYENAGLVVMGFPSDSFNQESLEGIKIGEFCEKNYGVDFKMFEKAPVKGDKTQPVFKFLVKQSKEPTQEVAWNFEKFLVNRKGQVIARFGSSTKPDSDMIRGAIEQALAEK
jgi:glutathione peroxidase